MKNNGKNEPKLSDNQKNNRLQHRCNGKVLQFPIKTAYFALSRFYVNTVQINSENNLFFNILLL
ncbi:MAG: hypothetical protein JXA91_07545, partial [Candidatus Thermoplasmatota archaeon]|nr:hypothetical protein [Candidatus Thermoplasmatota archaeon]